MTGLPVSSRVLLVIQRMTGDPLTAVDAAVALPVSHDAITTLLTAIARRDADRST